jgi:hypothetical protein
MSAIKTMDELKAWYSIRATRVGEVQAAIDMAEMLERGVRKCRHLKEISDDEAHEAEEAIGSLWNAILEYS